MKIDPLKIESVSEYPVPAIQHMCGHIEIFDSTRDYVYKLGKVVFVFNFKDGVKLFVSANTSFISGMNTSFEFKVLVKIIDLLSTTFKLGVFIDTVCHSDGEQTTYLRSEVDELIKLKDI